ncbi:hypothetical protein LEMLEM_LOCUS20565, partial [Lemmus lemmus]
MQFLAEIGSCWKPRILQRLLGVKGFRRVTSLVDLYSKHHCVWTNRHVQSPRKELTLEMHEVLNKASCQYPWNPEFFSTQKGGSHGLLRIPFSSEASQVA